MSPSNVRISYDGDVKLLDFGIAQAMLKFTSEIGVLKGKFSYMSPEQIRGMPVDARTDVFSAGIILHEMLTTEKLFRGDTEFALMEKVRKADVPPPSKFNRRVPDALDKIVAKALARDLPDRYQSAKELSDDLHAFVEQYRYKPEEMVEFMRNLFRVDYQKEAGEIASCQAASLDDEPEMSIESSLVLAEPTPPVGTANPPQREADKRTTGPREAIGGRTPAPSQSSSDDTAPTSAPPDGDLGSVAPSRGGGDGGFFSRLRKKFTK